ncbi:MAG: XRE family transcriptional regulator [Candidatus Cyclobacteriaceae bacterium M3_2C_046]
MTLISENIKYLRKHFRYTQEQLAEKIGIKRSLLGAYEEGRADPRLNNLLNISRIFEISVDRLISEDVSKLPEDSLSQPRPGNPTYPNLKVLSITVDPDNNENIDLVPQKASAGYLNGYADPEYLEELPKFKLPMLSQAATYRAFEISGDSMLPLEPGTIIIGQYLEDLNMVRNGSTYIILSKKEGVVYKRVFNYVDEKGKLFLVSDNKIYPPYDIDIQDVLEIWEAKAYISMKFPGPGTENDMTIEKLASIVLDLQTEVIKLKER